MLMHTCIIFCSKSFCASNFLDRPVDLCLCLQALRLTLNLLFFALDRSLMSPRLPNTKSISPTSASIVELPSFESMLISSSSILLIDIGELLTCSKIEDDGSILLTSDLNCVMS